jgi:NHL repeat-containing protein
MRRSFRLFLIAAAVFLCSTSPFAQLVIPEIPYDSAPNLLKGLPEDTYLGEAVGVATNAQGHIFVYSRTGTVQVTNGTERTFVRGNGGARLFEFDQTGKYVREIGQGLYGFVFAHAVRVDPQENVWIVDEGANQVIKFNPQGQVIMILGRKPEAITVPGGTPQARGGGAPAEGGGGAAGGRAGGAPAAGARAGGAAPGAGGGGGGGRGGGALPGAGAEGETFNRPTDVAWDAQGNIFIADGYGNSRVAKFDKNGVFVKTWGSSGTGPSQFNTVHSIATDAAGNVYVGDRGNRRIQVFDNNGTLKTMFLNVGAPWAVCITPGAHQYLYSSNSNGTGDFDHGGEIYKMELDGKIVGKFGKPGKLMKEFGSVHEIDCRNENEIYVGEITNWRVQKLSLHPTQAK